MLQCLIVGHAPWPLTHTAEPTVRKNIYLISYWATQWLTYNKTQREHWPVHVLRMIQWSMIGLQFTVISRQWWALWCWADLSSGLNWKVEILFEINDHSLKWFPYMYLKIYNFLPLLSCIQHKHLQNLP